MMMDYNTLLDNIKDTEEELAADHTPMIIETPNQHNNNNNNNYNSKQSFMPAYHHNEIGYNHEINQ